jgi:glutamate--cysteine ligase
LWDELEEIFGGAGVRLVSLGVDPWHSAESVLQQLPLPRYQAMDRFFASRWPAGAVMMRNTCAIQVNLEAGGGQVREERWLAANLLSPLLTAMFACSPGPGTTSRRARVWQQLDETRIGLPRWESADDADPVADCTARALAANVMFILRSDGAQPGRPGWSFRHWVEEGHPEAGRPTVADLECHLTTLFPEVRPRNGVLEMRAPDGIPRRWWNVPAVVVGSLLYADQARSATLELLEPLASDLNGVWDRAAREGLSDPLLGRLARQVADLTAEAARRQPERFAGPTVAATEAFLERFTLRGRCPGDELAELIPSPEKALAWATDDTGMGGLS